MSELTEEELLIWKEVPQEVKARIWKLLTDIYDAGPDGGEVTSSAIDTLEEYKKNLKNVL